MSRLGARVVQESPALIVHEKSCRCENCEAVREFAEAPTVEIPFETMEAVIRKALD